MNKHSATTMNVFAYSNYKEVLKKQIENNSHVYGYKTKLAQAAGCQKSFLSQVLGSHVQLMPEHALGIAQYWGLNPREKEYFVDLVNLERAATAQLKAFIRQRLERLKQENLDLSKRFQQKQLPQEWRSLYYSSWHYAAIHILLTIPGFDDVESIGRRLQLPEALVQTVLHNLQKMQLIRGKDGKWSATDKDVHIPKDSGLNSLNHNHWRQRAVQDSFLDNPGNVHYTAVYSLSMDDLEKLQRLVLSFVDDTRSLVVPSQEEELVCLTCDLFVV